MSVLPCQQAFEERMADNTRRASLSPPRPTPEGISELLAVISKLEKRSRLQVEPREESLLVTPSSSPIGVPKRVAEVLDSLASLSVCRPKHEVIAVALRLDPKSCSVELIISGNLDIPSSTLDHLRYIWSSMKALSDFMYRDNFPGLQDKSVHQKVKDPAYKAIATEFRDRCLEFSFPRLQQKVNGKFAQFMSIPTAGLASEHSFNSLRESLSYLERLFTRKEGPVHGKPHRDDTENWEILRACLTTFARSSGEFMRAGGFQGRDRTRSLGFLKLHAYLQKIASIPNSIDVLVKSAISPRCRDLFTFNMNLTPLPTLSGRLPRIAGNASEWQRVLEESLAYYNSFLDATRTNGQVLDMKIIRPDALYMSREAVSKDVIVHCETKLLAAIEKAQKEHENLPKAFTYIGVSKLSCSGCARFFAAYNHVHHTSWSTKGSHGKSYYPWMFPPVLPRREEVLRETYNIIVAQWVNAYRGCRPTSVPLVANTTAQFPPSVPAIEDSDEEIEAIMKKMRDLIKN